MGIVVTLLNKGSCDPVSDPGLLKYAERIGQLLPGFETAFKVTSPEMPTYEWIWGEAQKKGGPLGVFGAELAHLLLALEGFTIRLERGDG